MIALCPNPACAVSIPVDHPYPWCSACGERFPESLQGQLPRLQEEKARAAAAREALRRGPEIDAACGYCGNRFKASAKRDFQGFYTFSCPNCHEETIPPLGWGYRLAYWGFLAICVYSVVRSLLDKEDISRQIPVFLWIVALMRGIVRDLRIVHHRWRLRRG